MATKSRVLVVEPGHGAERGSTDMDHKRSSGVSTGCKIRGQGLRGGAFGTFRGARGSGIGF